MKYAFLFNRKVTQRYILKLCVLCGSFLRCRNSDRVTPKNIKNKTNLASLIDYSFIIHLRYCKIKHNIVSVDRKSL